VSGKQKLIPTQEELIKFSTTLPQWQLTSLDSLEDQWRGLLGSAGLDSLKITGADTLRSVISAGIARLRELIEAGDVLELQNILGSLRHQPESPIPPDPPEPVPTGEPKPGAA
jgi:hypothetical protein